MNKAFSLLLCLILFAALWIQTSPPIFAQSSDGPFNGVVNNEDLSPTISLPKINTPDFTALVFSTLHWDLPPPPLVLTTDTTVLLHNAIAKRLGIRYRFFGIDDRGYDCSGFVWRVFQDAGADFERVAARMLWQQLPEAKGEAIKQFGTLVFFNGLKHVGIVRDAYSFYHASRSRGVRLSFFSPYWGRRVTGYRIAPVPLIIEPLKIVKADERYNGQEE